LAHNRLADIPEDLGTLSSLVKLNLADNELILGTAWWLARLTSLQALSLENNRMIAIPVTVGVLARLEVLTVEGNPLRDPPRAVLLGGKAEDMHMSTFFEDLFNVLLPLSKAFRRSENTYSTM
jgi:Leucine-rich repeat (LRR) protein